MRLQIAIAEGIAQIPADAEENDLSLEMTPFERILLNHDESFFPLFSPL